MKAHVLHVVPTGGVGGVQTHVADLASGAAEAGMRVSVAVGGAGPLIRALARRGVPAVDVPMRRRTDLSAIHALQRLILEEDVDLVHTHSPLGGVLGRHAALRTRRPAVHTLHGLGVLDELRHPADTLHRVKLVTYRWHERWLNWRTQALIVPTPSIAAAAVRARHVPAERTVVIPHGVDLPVDGEPVRANGVLYVGRLHAEKGVDDLVAAFVEVRRAVPDATLRLVGEGPMRPALERQLRETGLDQAVALQGISVDGTAAFAGAICVVLPSRAEGLSYVLLEAMARGLVCVATAVGGTPDLIEHGRTGILVTPGDRAGLAKAIVSVLGDPAGAAALGTAAREVVRSRYRRQTMIERTLEVYRRALEAQR